MVGIGKITGRRIGTNRDGDVNRLILQVEMESDDVRTVEMINQFGEDTNPPNGCRVIVFDANGCKYAPAVSDNIAPTVDPGEKEFYSTNAAGTAKQATIKLNVAGEIILNGGTDTAVKFSALETAFNQLKSDFDAHVHAGVTVGVGNTGATTPSTADISPAEVPEVLL